MNACAGLNGCQDYLRRRKIYIFFGGAFTKYHRWFSLLGLIFLWSCSQPPRQPDPEATLSAYGEGPNPAMAQVQARQALAEKLLARINAQTVMDVTQVPQGQVQRYFRSVVRLRAPSQWQPLVTFKPVPPEGSCPEAVKASLPVAKTLQFYDRQLARLARQSQEAEQALTAAGSTPLARFQALVRLRDRLADLTQTQLIASVLALELKDPNRPDPRWRQPTERSYQAVMAAIERLIAAQPVDDLRLAAQYLTLDIKQDRVQVCRPRGRDYGQAPWAARLQDQLAAALPSEQPERTVAGPARYVLNGAYESQDQAVHLSYRLQDQRGDTFFTRTLRLGPDFRVTNSAPQDASPAAGDTPPRVLLLFEETRQVKTENRQPVDPCGQSAMQTTRGTLFSEPTTTENVLIGVFRESALRERVEWMPRDVCLPTRGKSPREIGRAYQVDYLIQGKTEAQITPQQLLDADPELAAAASINARLLDARTGQVIATSYCPDSRLPSQACQGVEFPIISHEEGWRAAIQKAARRLAEQSLVPSMQALLEDS